MRSFFFGVILTILALVLGGYFWLEKGYMSIEADKQPSAFERKIAMGAVDASLDRHAPEQKNPVQPTEENLVKGAKIFADNCAGCHGLPSNPDSQFGKSFYPPVPQFFKDAPDMPEHQNFYVIKHGTRWTGMPAWNGILNDNQIWTVAAFLSKIEKLPPAAQKALEPAPPAAASSTPPSH